WDYLRNAWVHNSGLRIDHFLLSAEAAKRLTTAGVDSGERAKTGASDHAPAWIELKDGGKMQERVTTPAKAPAKAAPATPVKSQPRGERPLLVIDGDNFAHRSYHALPSSIM